MTAPQEAAALDGEVVRVGCAALNYYEREIVELRFGLNGNGFHTLREVGDILGRCPSRIGDIEHRALRRIRKRLILAGLAHGTSWDAERIT